MTTKGGSIYLLNSVAAQAVGSGQECIEASCEVNLWAWQHTASLPDSQCVSLQCMKPHQSLDSICAYTESFDNICAYADSACLCSECKLSHIWESAVQVQIWLLPHKPISKSVCDLLCAGQQTS